MHIKKIAYNFILKNRIIDLNFNLELLFQIAKINNWSLCNYTDNKNLMYNLNLKRNLNLEAFTFNKDNKIIILYNDRLEINEILFAILHEFGHLLLNHTPHNEVIDPKLLIRQENEANLFACEVLAPSCVLKKLSIYNLEDLRVISNLPVKQAVDYLPLIKKNLILDEYSERVLRKFNNYFLNFSNIHINNEETRNQNKKFNYLLILSISFLAIVLIALFYLTKTKISHNKTIKYSNTDV